MSDVAAGLDLISKGGILAVAALIVWALVTERIVPKSRLDEQREERKEDEAFARKAHEDGLQAIKHVIDRLEEHDKKAEQALRALEVLLKIDHDERVQDREERGRDRADRLRR